MHSTLYQECLIITFRVKSWSGILKHVSQSFSKFVWVSYFTIQYSGLWVLLNDLFERQWLTFTSFTNFIRLVVEKRQTLLTVSPSSIPLTFTLRKVLKINLQCILLTISEKDDISSKSKVIYSVNKSVLKNQKNDDVHVLLQNRCTVIQDLKNLLFGHLRQADQASGLLTKDMPRASTIWETLILRARLNLSFFWAPYSIGNNEFILPQTYFWITLWSLAIAVTRS